MIAYRTFLDGSQVSGYLFSVFLEKNISFLSYTILFQFYFMFTFSFNSFVLLSSLESLDEAVSGDDAVMLLEYKGASYSKTVPRNLVDSSLAEPPLYLKRRRGSYDFYKHNLITLIITDITFN